MTLEQAAQLERLQGQADAMAGIVLCCLVLAIVIPIIMAITR